MLFCLQYLSTPESQSLRCDLIRYICAVIHPSNDVLCSDIIPRWAVIGWLLTTCTVSSQSYHTVSPVDYLMYKIYTKPRKSSANLIWKGPHWVYVIKECRLISSIWSTWMWNNRWNTGFLSSNQLNIATFIHQSVPTIWWTKFI